jgi:hypothetical protein
LGDGLAAGDGLPCLNGGEIKEVACIHGRGLAGALRCALFGGFDLADPVQVLGQVLGVQCPLQLRDRDEAGVRVPLQHRPGGYAQTGGELLVGQPRR